MIYNKEPELCEQTHLVIAIDSVLVNSFKLLNLFTGVCFLFVMFVHLDTFNIIGLTFAPGFPVGPLAPRPPRGPYM